MKDSRENMVADLHELIEVYRETNHIVSLVEAYMPELSLVVLNEFRMVLGHVMSVISLKDDSDKLIQHEIFAAKEHLIRARKDAFVFFVVSVSDDIYKKLEPINSDIIETKFPFYYSEIKPFLQKISAWKESYTEVASLVDRLAYLYRVFLDNYPMLIEAQNKENEKKVMNLTMERTYVDRIQYVALISAIISFLVSSIAVSGLSKIVEFFKSLFLI